MTEVVLLCELSKLVGGELWIIVTDHFLWNAMSGKQGYQGGDDTVTEERVTTSGYLDNNRQQLRMSSH